MLIMLLKTLYDAFSMRIQKADCALESMLVVFSQQLVYFTLQTVNPLNGCVSLHY